MIIRVVLAFLILVFSWSQVGAHGDHDDYYDHHHHDDDDWEEAYIYVGIGLAVAAGLTVLGAILFHPPRPPHLLGESQKTPPKIILEGGPRGIRIRF